MEEEQIRQQGEEDIVQDYYQHREMQIVELFQIQLQRNDQELIRQKILNEEDPLFQSDDKKRGINDQTNSNNNEVNTNQNQEQYITDNQQNGINLSFKYAITESDNQNQSPIYPAVISIDTHTKNGAKQRRVPIDLVCVVDNSASMSLENKMRLIRKSLRYLLKILNDDDRISIITFSTHSKIRTGFLRNSIENRQKLKTIIKKIHTASTTNIAEGMDNCMWLLKNRKYKNPITSVFLLSDGKDDHPGIVERVDDIMSKYKVEDIDFEINTFGYGSDHDPLELNGISQLRNGNFYFITELKRISEYFILALSALLNAVVENAIVSFDLHDFTINKIYGAENVWKKNNETQQYEIILPHLIEGDLKQFVCELKKNDIEQNQNNVIQTNQALQNVARLDGKILVTSKHINNDQISTTQIQATNLIVGSSVEDIRDININHLRVKGAEAISEARIKASIDKFEQAQEILNNFISELNNSQYSQDYSLNSLKDDLQKAATLCQKQEFSTGGQAFMIKKERTLLKRTGSISSKLGWTDTQQEIMKEYKEGKLALSDDSCPSRYGDEKLQDFNDFKDLTSSNQECFGKIIDANYIDADESNDNLNDKEDKNLMIDENEKKDIEIPKNLNQYNQEQDENNDQDFEDQDEDNHNIGEDEEEDEEVVLSSLAQKVMDKSATIDKITKKNII